MGDAIVELATAKACFNAAIDFAIELGAEGATFLHLWREGAWDELREDFPEFKGPLPCHTSEPVQESWEGYHHDR